jgi:hypothetical protein
MLYKAPQCIRALFLSCPHPKWVLAASEIRDLFNTALSGYKPTVILHLYLKTPTTFLTKTQLNYFGLQHFHTPNCLILW